MAKALDDSRQSGSAPQQLDERLVKAFSHPLRYRALVRLNEGVASPNELAREFGEPLGRVSYHVRTLASIGAIELVRTAPRRGALEHFYRAVVRPWFLDEEWAKLPHSTRRALFGDNLHRIVRDVTSAAAGGGFDHVQACVSYLSLELDGRAMGEVSALITETLERALRIQADAAARRTAGDAPQRLATELVLLHFEPAAD